MPVNRLAQELGETVELGEQLIELVPLPAPQRGVGFEVTQHGVPHGLHRASKVGGDGAHHRRNVIAERGA